MGERDEVGPSASGRDGARAGWKRGELYRLVYFSVSLVPALVAGGDREILKLLEASQRRNAKCAITGALAYNEFHFAQVLEGSRADVGDIFRSIERDPRHMKIQVVEEGWIARRDFSAWAMAYVGDPHSLRVISPNLQLRDIIASESRTAHALVEMMKFFLYPGAAER